MDETAAKVRKLLRQQAAVAGFGSFALRQNDLLKVLKEAGLVHDAPVGNRRVYSLDPAGLDGLRDYLDRFWNTALYSFKKRVEHQHQEKEHSDD